MSEKGNPIVSVFVLTYNSKKTVIETLESIKAQTYPNIELIISDDCSTDETVQLCRKWMGQNKARFERVWIIEAPHNMGTASNTNRAESACKGEWVKGIAGDDVLMPNCIQDCMDYVAEHPETVFLFGKQEVFGTTSERCLQVETVFDYKFFELPVEKQLHRLVFEGNCIPAPTAFYNADMVRKLGIYSDERIPLIEDWPKWINCLRKGVRFEFIDKVLVKYRAGGVSTGRHFNEKVYLSERQLCFRYLYPEWSKKDTEKAIERVVDDELRIYRYLQDIDIRLKQLESSKAYRLGKMLLKPFAWITKR